LVSKFIEHYHDRLFFRPLTKWPESLPALSYKGILISGFEHSRQHPVYELPSGPDSTFSQLIVEIYPSLTLPELARIIYHPLSAQILEPQQLIRTMGFHDSADFRKVLKLITQLPNGFQDWISSKKVGAQELFPLLNLTIEKATLLTNRLIELSETKSETIQRLEWTSDLVLMNHDIKKLLILSLVELRQTRFPNTTLRDEHLKSLNLPWSSHLKPKMQRRGDQSGFDVQFFASTPYELEKLADNLKKVATAWNSNLKQN
jgi:hypothetical protein